MAADHARVTGETHTAIEIAARARAGNGAATATLSRHAARLARGLAHVVNIIDPDVLVLGGGLSQLSHLYEQLPPLMAPHIFADQASVVIKTPKWGDASGTRGAARLWIYPSANNKIVSNHVEDSAWPIVNSTFLGTPYANMSTLSPSTLVLARPRFPTACMRARQLHSLGL